MVALHSVAVLEFDRTTVVKYPRLKESEGFKVTKVLSNSIPLPDLI